MSTKRRESIAYGLRAALAIAERRPESILRVFHSAARRREVAPLLKACAAQRRPYRELDEAALQRVAKTQHHEGVVVITEPLRALHLEAAIDRRPPIWLALDRVGNDHNIGAIARTMAWFGVRPLLWEAPSGHLSGAALRIAQGGLECIDRVAVPNLIPALWRLKEVGVLLIGATQGARSSCFAPLPSAPICWILGNEREGVSDEVLALCDERREIPGAGELESLNVSVSASILLSE